MWVCRLPVHIAPAECTGFYGNLWRIRDFPMGGQSRPQNVPLLTEICGEFAHTQGSPWAQGELSAKLTEGIRTL